MLTTACSRTERALLAGSALSLVGFTFSAYLTYQEVFTIHAICSWCVSSAVVFGLLAVVSSSRLLLLGRLEPQPDG